MFFQDYGVGLLVARGHGATHKTQCVPHFSGKTSRYMGMDVTFHSIWGLRGVVPGIGVGSFIGLGFFIGVGLGKRLCGKRPPCSSTGNFLGNSGAL